MLSCVRFRFAPSAALGFARRSFTALSQGDMNEICRLHQQNPDQYPIPLLAVKYKISKEKVIGVLKMQKLEAEWEASQKIKRALESKKKAEEAAKKKAEESTTEEGGDNNTTTNNKETNEASETATATAATPSRRPFVVELEETAAEKGPVESKWIPRYTTFDAEEDFVPPAIKHEHKVIVKSTSAAYPLAADASKSTRPKDGEFRYRYVFTEVGEGLNEDTRSVVVRDRDGSLRQATKEERITAELLFGGSSAAYRLKQKKWLH